MATEEAIRKAAGRKAYGYSLDDGNGTLTVAVRSGGPCDKREGNGSVEFRDEEGASPLGMGTQSEALACMRGQGLDWEGHK